MQFSDKKMQEYFDSLPAYVQESVMQSAVEFPTKGKLKRFVRNLHKRG